MRSILLAGIVLALPACGSDAPPPEPLRADAALVAESTDVIRSLSGALPACDAYELVCEPDPEPAPPRPEPAPTDGILPASSASASCDPNYADCVPIDSDVDCAGGSGNGPSYARGPVRVIGRDVYALDRDGDGVGCDR